MTRVLVLLVPLAGVAAFLVAVAGVHDHVRRASIVRWTAFGLVAALAAFAMLFLIGETLTDPGGWPAIGLIAAWLVPLVGLVLLAHLRPALAIRVLAVAALVPLGFGVWALLDLDGLRDWEDGVGPVGLVVLLVVGTALAVAGLSRPRPAGWLMVVVTVVPALLSMLGAGSLLGTAMSTAVLGVPVLVGGLLYVWAGALVASSGELPAAVDAR